MSQLKIADAITSGKYSFEQIAEMFNVRLMDVEITWAEMNDAGAWFYVQISEGLGE